MTVLNKWDLHDIQLIKCFRIWNIRWYLVSYLSPLYIYSCHCSIFQNWSQHCLKMFYTLSNLHPNFKTIFDWFLCFKWMKWLSSFSCKCYITWPPLCKVNFQITYKVHTFILVIISKLYIYIVEIRQKFWGFDIVHRRNLLFSFQVERIHCVVLDIPVGFLVFTRELQFMITFFFHTELCNWTPFSGRVCAILPTRSS